MMAELHVEIVPDTTQVKAAARAHSQHHARIADSWQRLADDLARIAEPHGSGVAIHPHVADVVDDTNGPGGTFTGSGNRRIEVDPATRAVRDSPHPFE